jgi:hypothetical protein
MKYLVYGIHVFMNKHVLSHTVFVMVIAMRHLIPEEAQRLRKPRPLCKQFVQFFKFVMATYQPVQTCDDILFGLENAREALWHLWVVLFQ